MTEQNNKTETAVSTAASTVAPKKAANTRRRPAGNHKEKKAKSNLSQDAAKKEKAKEKPQTAANKENRGRRGSGMAQAEQQGKAKQQTKQKQQRKENLQAKENSQAREQLQTKEKAQAKEKRQIKTKQQTKPAKQAKANASQTQQPKAAPAKNTSRTRNKKINSKLAIIPLGGLGEIGKNMTAIRYEDHIVVIDGGMAFPDNDMLGIDLVIPDYTYLIENRHMVEAIALTHGHEDHIGGIPYLLREINAPIYGGKLTLGLLKQKLKEHHISDVSMNVVESRDTITAGPLKIEFIRVSHSIPDSFAVAVHTPMGVILHTGDFKMDMSPVSGEPMDYRRLAALGEKGVLCLLSDSTNAEREGYTASERTIGGTLDAIFHNAPDRIIMTTFASNVHRVQQAIWAAEHCGRKVAVVGRGMTNVVTISRELGYLDVGYDTMIPIEDINKYPLDRILIITTGSQGEQLAGLTRMSLDEHRQVQLLPGDTVVISANAIPGNELFVSRTIDNLYRHGAQVIYGPSWGVHVSGHAASEELKMMLNLVRPRFFMPAHGEYRMLCRHGQLAESSGIPKDNIFIMDNGDVLELNRTSARVTTKVQSGRVLVDGFGVGDVGAAVLKDRQKLAGGGIVVAVMAVDTATNQIVSGPEIITKGFVFEKENDNLLDEAKGKVLDAFRSTCQEHCDVGALKGAMRSALGRLFYDNVGRRPVIVPSVLEVE